MVPDALEALLDEVAGWFRLHPDHEELKRLFTELVHQAIAGFGAPVPIPDDLAEMKTMLATLAESWKQGWKAEGKIEGKIEGKGEALVRLAERRFGPLPDALRQRVETADAASIEGWLDGLFDATSLEMLFGPTN